MVTMKYRELTNFEFVQTMQKIVNAPTHGQAASQIHRATKVVNLVQKDLRKEFQETIAKVYGKTNEKGELIRPAEEPSGFETIEGKEEELKAAEKAFAEKTVELDIQPFTIQLLGDMKISARDLENLKGLYIGNREDGGKPALPDASKVASIR